MSIKEYAKRVCEKIDNMSDEEFEKLLIESGLEACPIEPESVTFQTSITYSVSDLYNCEAKMLVARTDNPSRAVA